MVLSPHFSSVQLKRQMRADELIRWRRARSEMPGSRQADAGQGFRTRLSQDKIRRGPVTFQPDVLDSYTL